MTRRIQRLSLRSFRGASQNIDLDFDANAPITLIFGENGTGKSTLCDAIDFVCNGRFGSLQEKSSVLRAADSVVALGSQPGDLSVTLRYNNAEWLARLKGTKPVVSGPEQRPIAHILRRADITRVVEAAPKEKYEALKLFIAAPAIEKIEKSLRDALTSIKKQLEEAGRAKAQADDTLNTLWQGAGSPGTDAYAWAEAFSALDQKTLHESVQQQQARIDALRSADAAHARYTQARDKQSDLRSSAYAAETQLQQLASRSSGHNAALARLLRDVRIYLSDAHADVCPVCGRPSDAQHLRMHVDQQLAAMTAITEAQQAFDTAQAALMQQTHAVESAERALIEATQASSLHSALTAVENSQRAVAELTAQLDLDRAALAQFTTITTQIKTVQSKTQPLIDGFQTQLKLEKMLEIVERNRKAHVDRVLEEISTTVDTLYGKIHPQEELGEVSFYLKPNTIGSLEFDGRFQGAREVPPAAYYSEAHLDTLGLCVYLALAKHMQQDAIIVLDDVLTSIDDAHLSRVIQLLHDEAPAFNQVIITTHFRAWRDKYRFFQAPSQQVQLIQLHRWSIERGIRHTKDQLWIDDLRDALSAEAPDRQAIASKAGILLEGMLDHLSQLYRLRLPRRVDNDYTLVELARAFDAKLKRVLRVVRDGKETALEAYITQIDSTAWIRNQVGAHFNAQAALVPDAEVFGFARLTLQFAEALVCPVCGQIPGRSRSGSDYECQCGRTHLSPLVAPT